MSTPELLRRYESCVIGGSRHLPGVDDDRDETENIRDSRSDVQPRELLPGSFLLLRRASIFHLVKIFELRCEDIAAQQAEREHQNQQPKGKAAKRTARVNHVCAKMD